MILILWVAAAFVVGWWLGIGTATRTIQRAGILDEERTAQWAGKK